MESIYLVIWERNPRTLTAISPQNYLHAGGWIYCQFNTVPVDPFSAPAGMQEI